jgi:hypothetical protein
MSVKFGRCGGWRQAFEQGSHGLAPAFGLEERRGNFGQSFWHVDHGAVRAEHEHLDLALEFLGGACWGAPKEKRYREHDKS